jgi:hypothetical protein
MDLLTRVASPTHQRPSEQPRERHAHAVRPDPLGARRSGASFCVQPCTAHSARACKRCVAGDGPRRSWSRRPWIPRGCYLLSFPDTSNADQGGCSSKSSIPTMAGRPHRHPHKTELLAVLGGPGIWTASTVTSASCGALSPSSIPPVPNFPSPRLVVPAEPLARRN